MKTKELFSIFPTLTSAAAFLILCGCATTQTHTPRKQHSSDQQELRVEKRQRKAGTLPRIVLIIDEKHSEGIPTSEVEAMGADLFIERGFSVVDQDTVRANIKKDQQLLLLSGDVRGAKNLGLQLGADVIVVGEVVAKPSARRIGDTNLRAYQAAVTLRAVRTDNSATIASASETDAVAALEDVSSSSQAVKKTSRKAFGILIPRIESAWDQRATASSGPTGQTVAITIRGIDKAWKLKAARDSLRELSPQISAVTQRSYSTGVAIFEITTSMRAESLIEALISNPPEGLKYQLVDVQPGKISVRAVAVEDH